MTDERTNYLEWRASSAGDQATQEQRPAPQGTDPTEAYDAWRAKATERAAEQAALVIEQSVPAQDAAAAVSRSDEARAQGLNLTPDLLTSATSELTRRIDGNTRRTQLASSTRLSGWVTQDPINAALAQAELQNLTATSGLIQSLARGADVATTGAWARRGVRKAEERLDSLRQRGTDRDLGLGSILDDVKADITVDNVDQNLGATVAKTYGATLARYLSSRITFGSDEKLARGEAYLADELGNALQRATSNSDRINKRYGSSARVAKVTSALEGIGKTEGMRAQLSGLGALIKDAPVEFTEWLANVVVESSPSLAVGAAATAATANPAVGAVAMGYTSGTLGEASTFDKLVRDAGYDLSSPEQRIAFVNDPATRRNLRDNAFAYGAVVGLMDAASGGVASRTLVGNQAGELVLQSMTQAVMGGGGEALGALASGQDINMVDVLVEGLAELATAPVEVTTVGGRYLNQRRGAAQDRQFFEALAAEAEGSDMRKNVPAKYREALTALTQDGPVETLHVDAQSLDELFQSQPEGVTAEAFLANVAGVDVEAYRLALDTGGTFEIPTASYATDIVGTDFDALVRDHLRTNPERMSVAELRALNERSKELSAQTQAAVDRAESGQTELEQVAETARVELVSSLQRAGRTPDAAENEALQAVAFARTTASRLGMPLQDFLARYPLADVRDGEAPQIARAAVAPAQKAPAPLDVRTEVQGLADVLARGSELASGDVAAARAYNAELDAAYEALKEVLPNAPDADAISAMMGEGADPLDPTTYADPEGVAHAVGLSDLFGRISNALQREEATVDELLAIADEVTNPVQRSTELNQSAPQRSEEFDAWFGGSEVVDENGDPQVMYHGSTSDIEAFNTEGGRGKTAGTGAFFTDNPETANTYGTSVNGGNVTPVYLSVQNPMRVDADGDNWNDIDARNDAQAPETEVQNGAGATDIDELAALMSELGFDADEDGGLPEVTYHADEESELGYIMRVDGETISTDDIVRFARSRGHDGVVIDNVVDRGPYGLGVTEGSSRPSRIVAVFDPTQIKSVNNRGTYDPNDGRILYQSDGTDFKTLLAAAKARVEAKAELLVSTKEAPTRLSDKHGKKGFVGPDPSNAGGFRFSYFGEDGQPSGHNEHKTFKDALRDALDAGFAPVGEGARVFYQDKVNAKRGSILLPRQDGEAPVVSLFEKADLSTFLHESGHYYLHVLQDIAQRGEQTGNLLPDWQTINEWWGDNVEGVAKDGDVSQESVNTYLEKGTTGAADTDRKIGVGLQEQWARAFEQYLLEGKAPSNALRTAFESFSAWLVSVYNRTRGLDVNVSDELRGVFDRLLATDEEIADATHENGFDKLVAASAAELGVTDREYETLVRLSTEAQDEARQGVLKSVMAPIRRAATAEYKAERKEVEDDVRLSVNAKPANRVREWLGNGRWLDGDTPTSLPEDLRLDRALLLEEHGKDIVDALPRGRRPIWLAGSGVSADDVAGWFGYSSGSEMLNDLIATPLAAAEIQSRTDATMRQRHGDPLTDGTIEQEALTALHGEKRGQLIAAELRAIGKSGKHGKVTSRSQAREVARRTIRQMPVRQATRSGTYLAAERRAGARAADAMLRGNRDEAFAAKREQLLNNQLYAESRKAAEVVAKTESRVAALKRKGTRKNLAGEYLDAIDDILLSYDFRKSTTQRAAQRRQGVQAYVDMMKEAGRENELAIPAHVLDEAKRKPYKSLSVAELEGVYDSLRNIEHTARMKQKLRDAQSERDMTTLVEGITEEFDANLSDVKRNRVATSGDKARESFREFADLLLNAETLLRKIGGQEAGAAYDAIKSPIDAAANWASEQREAASKKFEDMYGVYDAKEVRAMSVRKFHKELDGSFTKWDLISAALNMGNSDNMARLMDTDSGSGFNAAQIDYIKEQLDKRDWDFVQGSWDYINSFWPQIVARERRLTGVSPRKVEASPVDTPHGSYEGGYYPIKYRSDVSGMVAAEDVEKLQQGMLAGRFGKAQTSNGHLEERAKGSGGRVLHLGVDVMHMHVGQVIHDLAFSEPAANAWRVLQDVRVRSKFEQKGLLKDYQALELWLQDTAAGQMAAGGIFGRLALRAKNGFTLSKLAFNLSTAAVQLTGVTQSMVVVGSHNMARGYSTYLSNPQRAVDDVLAVSPFMRERETTFNRDINDILGDVMSGPAASRVQRLQQAVGRYGFWLIQKVQFYGVDMPTWYGGYHQSLKAHGDEAKARNDADRAVARAQASGVFSDRSAFERGTLSSDTRQNGFVRLFTTLGSAMFAKGNVAYEVAGRTRRDIDGANLKSLTAAIKGATDMVMLFTVEAIAYNLIKGTLPHMGDVGEDDDGWAEFLAKETALSAMSTVPIIRDVGSSFSGFDAGAYGSVISTFTKPFIEAEDGEADLAFFKALSSAAGTATGLPTGQLNKTVDAWYRSLEGDDVAPIEFIMGRR